MLRLAAATRSASLALLLAAFACSEEDAPLLDGSGGSAGRGGASAGRGGGGSSSGEAGEGGGGDLPQGGQPAPQGGASNAEGGAESGGGGDESRAGAGGEPVGVGGGTPPPEPDLITLTGGPWPDSLTAICSNGSQLGVCPQRGAPHFGQDGTYRINVPTYLSTSSTLTDQVTGLVWQVAPPLQDLTHAEASSYCDQLELSGQTDWRLPTRLEYVSLLDAGKGAGYALPPGIAFDATGTYWTASPSAMTPGLYFVVDDAAGTWNVVVEDTTFDARCVRGAALTGELQVGDGVVTDTMTQLTWQASELTDTPRTWLEALAYCESLSLGGKTDWRLPSIKELATIVDESATTSPVIADSLGGAARPEYWSSTPAEPFLSDPAAFVLETDFGISMTLNMTENAAARCVRSAD